MKPRVAVTSRTEMQSRGPYATVNRNYLDSVVRAGGLPWILPPTGDEDDAGLYLHNADGLLVTGGADVWPPHYGEDPRPEVTVCDPARDRWEMALVKEARRRGLPVFGVCRGLQIINVALGGTLYQDLPAQVGGPVGHSPDLPMDELWHRIHLEPGASLVRQVFGRDEAMVNSFHHQAVKDLAPGLRVTAKAGDGVVEAFEGTDGPWLAAVQFHPETLTARYPEFVGLFAGLVSAGR